MMGLLKQKNTIENVAVERIFIDRIEKDGPFDIAHVCITATMKDRFICETIPALNSEGDDRFTEYWSFIRKAGAPKKNMYATFNCPSCSAPLPDDLGETGKCTCCNTLINTGEFDWVLSEITQVDDYAGRRAMAKMQGFERNINFIRKHFADFSIQHVEDKAGNGYLQMQTAIVFKKKPEIMRRFADDNVAAGEKKLIDHVRQHYVTAQSG
ncbi:MAG: hypothetical protein JW913_17475 [Chitinispirillaceae bacterium]|nr:hypothetical protein [Chitinispirillaceae bacterium]